MGEFQPIMQPKLDGYLVGNKNIREFKRIEENKVNKHQVVDVSGGIGRNLAR